MTGSAMQERTAAARPTDVGCPRSRGSGGPCRGRGAPRGRDPWFAAVVAGLVLIVAAGCGTPEPDPDDVVDSQTHWRDFLSGHDVPGSPGEEDGGAGDPIPESSVNRGPRVLVEGPDSLLLVDRARGVLRWSVPSGTLSGASPEAVVRGQVALLGSVGDRHLISLVPETAAEPLEIGAVDEEEGAGNSPRMLATTPEAEGTAFVDTGVLVPVSMVLGDGLHFVSRHEEREILTRAGRAPRSTYTTRVDLHRLESASAPVVGSVELEGRVTAMMVDGLRMVVAVTRNDAETGWQDEHSLRALEMRPGDGLHLGEASSLDGEVRGGRPMRWRTDGLEVLSLTPGGATWSVWSVGDQLDLARMGGEIALGDATSTSALIGDELHSVAITRHHWNRSAWHGQVHVVRRDGEVVDPPETLIVHERPDGREAGAVRGLGAVSTQLSDGRWLLVDAPDFRVRDWTGPTHQLQILDVDDVMVTDLYALDPEVDAGARRRYAELAPWLQAGPAAHALNLTSEDALLLAFNVREESEAGGAWTRMQLVEAGSNGVVERGLLRHPGTLTGWMFPGDGRVVTFGNQAVVIHDLSDPDNPVSGRPVWRDVDTVDLIPDGDAALRLFQPVVRGVSHGESDAGRYRVQRVGPEAGPDAVDPLAATAIRSGTVILPRGNSFLLATRQNVPSETDVQVHLAELETGSGIPQARDLGTIVLGDVRNMLFLHRSSDYYTLMVPSVPPAGQHDLAQVVADDVLLLRLIGYQSMDEGREEACQTRGLRSSSPLYERRCFDESDPSAEEDMPTTDVPNSSWTEDSTDGEEGSAQGSGAPLPGAGPCVVLRAGHRCVTHESGAVRCSGQDVLCEVERTSTGTGEVIECRALTPEERAEHTRTSCEERRARRTTRTVRFERVALDGPEAPRILPAIELDSAERAQNLQQHHDALHLVTSEDVLLAESGMEFVRWSFRLLEPAAEGSNALGPRIDTPGRLLARFGDLLLTLRQQPSDTGTRLVLHLAEMQDQEVNLLDTRELGSRWNSSVWAQDPEHIVVQWEEQRGPELQWERRLVWLRIDEEARRLVPVVDAQSFDGDILGLRDGMLLVYHRSHRTLLQIPLVEGAPLAASHAIPRGWSTNLHRLLHLHGLWHAGNPDPVWEPARTGW